MDFEVVKKTLKARGKQLTDATENYLRRCIYAPVYGFPVIGVSGSGKTSSIMNVMSDYPQVLEHTCYQDIPFNEEQLVWLKVDCPGDGTPKGLCTAIIREVDKVLGTDYSDQIIRKRMSMDFLLLQMSQLVRRVNMGILIIDDVQNLMGVRKTVSRTLLCFMSSLYSYLSIPVVMVGTPKILLPLQKDFHLARRVFGEGLVRMKLMDEIEPIWDRFISTLWKYQYTRNAVKLTRELSHKLYEMSAGNPFFASLIYKVAQELAIINHTETFTESDIVRVAGEILGMTDEIRKSMLNGADVDLEQYKIYWNECTNGSWSNS